MQGFLNVEMAMITSQGSIYGGGGGGGGGGRFSPKHLCALYCEKCPLECLLHTYVIFFCHELAKLI